MTVRYDRMTVRYDRMTVRYDRMTVLYDPYSITVLLLVRWYRMTLYISLLRHFFCRTSLQKSKPRKSILLNVRVR